MEAVETTTSYLQTALSYSLLSIATVLFAAYIYIDQSRTHRLGSKLPGPTGVPILGNALLTLGLHPNYMLERLLKYDVFGPVTRANVGKRLIVFIYHPRDVEIILSSSVHIDKSPEYRYFEPWLGKGLLTSNGEKWRYHRKIIAPTFNLNVLKTFVPLFYENSMDLVVRLRDQVGKEFDCHDYLSAVTVDILMETAMGLKRSEKHKTSHDYAVAVMKMCDIVHRRQYYANLRFDFIFKFTKLATVQEKMLQTIHGLTAKVIQEKKEETYRRICSNTEEDQNQRKVSDETAEKVTEKETEETKTHYFRDDLDETENNDTGKKKKLAFLDLMLEMKRNGAKLTDEEIEEEVNTLMFEGHDTTAAGSSFVLCVLGIHQDVQERVYEEMNEIFKGSDRPCTYQDTLEMKYLERVIFETMRLFPPVPAIARLLNEDVKLATKDYIVPKGSTILITPFRVHRLAEFYPEPDKFNPDNFLPERMQNRHHYAFIPFSAGPRSCVGRKYAMLKLKVLLSTVLRNYRILSDLTEKDFRLKIDIILKRVDGFRIKIEPRNKSSQEVHV